MKPSPEKAKKLRHIKATIEHTCKESIVAYSYDESMLVYLEPKNMGDSSSSMHNAEKIFKIVEVFNALAYVAFGHPPTDHEGATNQVLFIGIF